MRSYLPIVLLSFLFVTRIACAADECEAGEKQLFANKYSEAVSLTSKCLTNSNLNSQSRVRALQVRAWAYFNLRKDTLAVADQEESFKIKPPFDHREFINYSSYLRRVKRYEESLEALQNAEIIDRTEGRQSMMTQYNIGWTLTELRRYEDAIKAFSKGIPVQPDYPYVYWRRGLAFEALGKNKEAAKDYEMAAKLISDSRDKWVEEEFLAAIRIKVKQYGIDKKYAF
jgi:tetratricopeptide (TPR) repeat protein